MTNQTTAVLDGEDGRRPISNSELRTFKRCRRKWWLTYYRGLRATVEEPTGPRALGSRLHLVLARYYDPADTEIVDDATCLGWLRTQLEEDLAAFPAQESDIRKEFDLATAMLDGYFQWLAETGVDADLDVVDIERGVVVPMNAENLTRPAALVARLDVAVRSRATGAMSFIDHKTVANLTDIPKNAELDEQFLHYSLIQYLRHLDDPSVPFVDGGVFNMLRKVKRTKAARPPFYGRHEVRHSLDELRAYWYRVAGEIADLMTVERTLDSGTRHQVAAYPNPTRDCGWDCDFRQVCPLLDAYPSGAEAFIDEAFVTVDQYARYGLRETDA